MRDPARFAGMYALVDPAAHADAAAYLAGLLRGGIRLVQVRAKNGIAPQSHILEAAFLPNVNDLIAAAKEIL